MNAQKAIPLHFSSGHQELLSQGLSEAFEKKLENCDIDFFNIRHCQVQNFKILNQSGWDQNFAVNFQKHQKQKYVQYIEIECK